MSITERGDYAGSVVDEWGNRVFTLTDEFGRSGTFVSGPVGQAVVRLEDYYERAYDVPLGRLLRRP